MSAKKLLDSPSPRSQGCLNQQDISIMPRCRICQEPYKPRYTSLQKTCNDPKCILAWGRKQQEKAVEARRKAERKALRVRKEAIKTKPQLIKTAQEGAFNPYIRARDSGMPCPTCGRSEAEVNGSDGWRPGGAWDCGHIIAVGAEPGLRFHEFNAMRQCKNCNGGSGQYTRKNHTISAVYKEAAIGRFGARMVEWLEGPHETQNWTHEDLRDIKQYYRDKIKLLEGK